MQGRALAGKAKAEPNEFVFCTRDRMDERYDMMRSVMDSRWLYIRNYRPDLPYVQPLEYMFRARGYQSWARLARDGKLTPATSRFWGGKPVEELYDMLADPDSVHNRAADPACRDTMERMRSALAKRIIANNDNGFLPEGSALEGYDASRVPGAFPIGRVLDLANLASERLVANLPKLVDALGDPSEPVRWWAAQGCAMLGNKAGPAEAALRRCLDDKSGPVRVAAAEALARLGKLDAALPVLAGCLAPGSEPGCIRQAANVLDRPGEVARPALPAMKAALVAAPATVVGDYPPQHILEHAIAVLEGREQVLVYPEPGGRD